MNVDSGTEEKKSRQWCNSLTREVVTAVCCQIRTSWIAGERLLIVSTPAASRTSARSALSYIEPIAPAPANLRGGHALLMNLDIEAGYASDMS